MPSKFIIPNYTTGGSSVPGINANNYTPNFYNIDSDGLTCADIIPWTPELAMSMGFRETGMDAGLARAQMARLVGVKQNSLADILRSRMVSIPHDKGVENGSIIAPFNFMKRESQVNIGNFLLTAGSTSAPSDAVDAIPGTLPATTWWITVSASTGGYGSDISNVYAYFLPGKYLHCSSKVYHTQTAYKAAVVAAGGSLEAGVRVQYRIVWASAKSGNTKIAYVAVAPTEFQSYETTKAAWDTYVAGSGAAAVGGVRVEKGSLVILANSVSERESWCYQPPVINNLGVVEYWDQTERQTFMWNDEFVTAIKAPKTSDWFKTFYTLPLAEHRRQIEDIAEKEFLNTCFHGDRISDKQTRATYDSLPVVYDATNPGSAYEFKSNTLGFETQLNEAGAIRDMSGGPLDIDWIKAAAYQLKRVRGSSQLDMFMDRVTLGKVRQILTAYLKGYLQVDTLTAAVQEGKQILDPVNKKALWNYCTFDLPEEGVQCNLFQHDYFDDNIAASAALGANSDQNAARQLWIPDWSDFKIGIKSERSVHKDTNLNDPLYKCVMRQDVNHYELYARKFQCRLGDANRHVLIKNFSTANPKLTLNIAFPQQS